MSKINLYKFPVAPSVSDHAQKYSIGKFPANFYHKFLMNQNTPLPSENYHLHPLVFAKRLLGCVIQVGECSGRIVETEAYTGPPEDLASHSYTRANSAAELMKTAGLLYVYSIHNGLAANITCNSGEYGAVLIRAIEPLEGIPEMVTRRSRKKTKVSQQWDLNNYKSLKTMSNGPIKLCEALGIQKQWNRSKIGKNVKIFKRDQEPEIQATKRIGISQSTDYLWRFCDANSDFLSRPL